MKRINRNSLIVIFLVLVITILGIILLNGKKNKIENYSQIKELSSNNILSMLSSIRENLTSDTQEINQTIHAVNIGTMENHWFNHEQLLKEFEIKMRKLKDLSRMNEQKDISGNTSLEEKLTVIGNFHRDKVLAPARALIQWKGKILSGRMQENLAGVKIKMEQLEGELNSGMRELNIRILDTEKVLGHESMN
jgi:hypothetical protein